MDTKLHLGILVVLHTVRSNKYADKSQLLNIVYRGLNDVHLVDKYVKIPRLVIETSLAFNTPLKSLQGFCNARVLNYSNRNEGLLNGEKMVTSTL